MVVLYFGKPIHLICINKLRIVQFDWTQYKHIPHHLFASQSINPATCARSISYSLFICLRSVCVKRRTHTERIAYRIASTLKICETLVRSYKWFQFSFLLFSVFHFVWILKKQLRHRQLELCCRCSLIYETFLISQGNLGAFLVQERIIARSLSYKRNITGTQR